VTPRLRAGKRGLPMTPRTLLLTAVTLVAFAANSVLCRIALKAELIDPIAFTQLRLGAGALALLPFLIASGRARVPGFMRTGWRPALVLFVYAIPFSLAYVALDAGVGALILFGSVQIAMLGIGALGGARPSLREWVGLAIAFGGLVWLAAPGLAAPPLWAALSMAAAGVAWGVYSILGRGEADPVAATARNFLLTTPLLALLFLAGSAWREAAPAGIALAIVSGALTSGLGYVIWYAALRGLAPASASIVQLAVPVIAALGGVAFLAESFSVRLSTATVLVLGGVLLALTAKLARRSRN
jgi:drug/metabolite transporter (DMT)-like permease